MKEKFWHFPFRHRQETWTVTFPLMEHLLIWCLPSPSFQSFTSLFESVRVISSKPQGSEYPCSYNSNFTNRYIKIGDKECEYNPSFRLILHTKLASPHYQPELQAQCTLVNFTVTRDGLEDQLLAAVVSMERPDLEQLKVRQTEHGAWYHSISRGRGKCYLIQVASSINCCLPRLQHSTKQFNTIQHNTI